MSSSLPEFIRNDMTRPTIEPHKLDRMLIMQADLQRMINKGKSLEEFTDEERMEAIRTNVLACVGELYEAMNETGWKPWATSNHVNREAFYVEMVDAWHFFMNLMLHTGMTAEDLYRGYLEKNKENWERYSGGNYDGVTGKCPKCKRDYNGKGVMCTPATGGPMSTEAYPEPAYCAVEDA